MHDEILISQGIKKTTREKKERVFYLETVAACFYFFSNNCQPASYVS